jgi:hypothetical protein
MSGEARHDAYAAWMTQVTPEEARRQCRELTAAMAELFPELRRVRGHYDDPLTGRRPHWWLVAPDGAVVDPTASQFAPCGDYVPRDESLPEPTGVCLGCGAEVYGGDTFCGSRCRDEVVRTMRFAAWGGCGDV